MLWTSLLHWQSERHCHLFRKKLAAPRCHCASLPVNEQQLRIWNSENGRFSQRKGSQPSQTAEMG